MKLSKSDLLPMRRNILAVCASAIASAIILYSSNEYAESARNDRRNAQNLLDDTRNRLTIALQDRENMEAYAGEYGALVEQKIVGDDQRLDWMEGLEKIRQKNLVMDFRYNIAPQKIYTPQPPIDSGNFDIHYSEIKLQFDLLHEAQLLGFFDALHGDIKGWYQLEGCTLQRSIPADQDNGNATAMAHLRAECRGGWITLKNRNTSK